MVNERWSVLSTTRARAQMLRAQSLGIRCAAQSSLGLIEECIEPLRQSVKLRNVGRQERTTPDDSCFGDSRLPSFIPNKNPYIPNKNP
jgi:hypothetical protein